VINRIEPLSPDASDRCDALLADFGQALCKSAIELIPHLARKHGVDRSTAQYVMGQALLLNGIVASTKGLLSEQEATRLEEEIFDLIRKRLKGVEPLR